MMFQNPTHITHTNRTDQYGGRVMYSSSPNDFKSYIFDTCVVVDLPQWPDGMNVCIKSRYDDWTWWFFQKKKHTRITKPKTRTQVP